MLLVHQCIPLYDTLANSRSIRTCSSAHKPCAHTHTHTYTESKEPCNPSHHPSLTSSAYIPSFLPFSLYTLSFLVNRTKDSGEGDGVKHVSCGITFDPNKTDTLSSWVSSSLFLNLSSPLSQEKGIVIYPCTLYPFVTKWFFKKLML